MAEITENSSTDGTKKAPHLTPIQGRVEIDSSGIDALTERFKNLHISAKGVPPPEKTEEEKRRMAFERLMQEVLDGLHTANEVLTEQAAIHDSRLLHVGKSEETDWAKTRIDAFMDALGTILAQELDLKNSIDRKIDETYYGELTGLAVAFGKIWHGNGTEDIDEGLTIQASALGSLREFIKSAAAADQRHRRWLAIFETFATSYLQKLADIRKFQINAVRADIQTIGQKRAA